MSDLEFNFDFEPTDPELPEEAAFAALPVKNTDLTDEEGTDFGGVVSQIGETLVLFVPQVSSPAESMDGKRMLPVTIPEGVDAWVFNRILTAAWSQFLLSGNLEKTAISKRANVSPEQLGLVARTEQFARALELRGVNIQEVATLTPQQETALMILTDVGSTKTFGQRLELSGISHSVFLAWMKNPRFAEAMHGIAEAITENSSIALVELGRKVGEGDLRAIQLQLEVNGRHNPQQQQTVDMLVVMNKILESLATHLAGNPEVLRLVASDMRQIAQQAQVQKIPASRSLEI